MATDEIKRAAPLELFFALVFVFAITQIVSLIVHDLTWTGMFHGGLVLALLWWAWSHYTWTANGVDLEPRMMRIGYLAAMVVIFIMAHAVPFAFEGQGHWLAYGYLLIRVLAFYLGFTGSTDAVEMMRSLRTWLPWAMLGPIAVIIGAYMGDAQQWWWLAGWILELASSAVAGTSEWELNVEHFAERHGLIMIIAFGEAIVVIGSTVSTEPPSWDLAGVLAVGILGAWLCGGRTSIASRSSGSGPWGAPRLPSSVNRLETCTRSCTTRCLRRLCSMPLPSKWSSTLQMSAWSRWSRWYWRCRCCCSCCRSWRPPGEVCGHFSSNGLLPRW